VVGSFRSLSPAHSPPFQATAEELASFSAPIPLSFAASHSPPAISIPNELASFCHFSGTVNAIPLASLTTGQSPLFRATRHYYGGTWWTPAVQFPGPPIPFRAACVPASGIIPNPKSVSRASLRASFQHGQRFNVPPSTTRNWVRFACMICYEMHVFRGFLEILASRRFPRKLMMGNNLDRNSPELASAARSWRNSITNNGFAVFLPIELMLSKGGSY